MHYSVTCVTYIVHLCALTFALPAASPFSASPFSVSQFLETYEDKFLEVVNPKLSLLKLKHKGVISADVRTSIESANDEDAKYTLLEHLQKNATVDTLRVYCDVAIAANGFPRMQELGKKMMDAPHLKVGLICGCLHVCVCVYCLLVYMCMCIMCFLQVQNAATPYKSAPSVQPMLL